MYMLCLTKPQIVHAILRKCYKYLMMISTSDVANIATNHQHSLVNYCNDIPQWFRINTVCVTHKMRG